MYCIGIDLGGTNIACGLVNEEGKILCKKSCKTGASRPATEIMADMAELVKSVLAEGGISLAELGYCGIAAPGVCDSEKGEIVWSCNLPGFFRFSVVEDLKNRLQFDRIGLENDANCAAIGEAQAGAAKGVTDSVFVTLGTGVGGGVILKGKLLNGFNFAGGELGHMVIEKDGFPCGCGRRGCFECYSSATALCRMTREAMEGNKDSLMWHFAPTPDQVDGRTCFDAVRRNDPAAKEVLDRFTSYLACGITNLVNIFQPEILSVGGGISAEGETLLAPVRKILEAEQYSRNCEKKTVLKKAELGNDAGIIGAALLWRSL